MLSSVTETTAFSFIDGMGGGACAGGGGAERSFCGIVGGAREGIFGSAVVILGAGLDFLVADSRCEGFAGGPFKSSGKRNECMVVIAGLLKNCNKELPLEKIEWYSKAEIRPDELGYVYTLYCSSRQNLLVSLSRFKQSRYC
jgi:hypothetical protein